ncbi:MAG: DUF2721 domain-containing protein [Pseudomonadota bacterium]
MDPTLDNPFVILSYIAGPALLTNACSLLVLAVTNRFGRSVDRARQLSAELCSAPASLLPVLRRDLEANQRRARVIAFALGALYLASGMFALATMLSIVGAAFAHVGIDAVLGVDVIAAAVAGGVGFLALLAAAVALIMESRLALAALMLEAEETELRLLSNSTS